MITSELLKSSFRDNCRYLIFAMISLVAFSCNSKRQNPDAVVHADSNYLQNAVSVKTKILERKSFKAEIISNGKVISFQEIPINFPNPGIINRIMVKNGALVKAGQLLATLANEEQKLLVLEAQLQLDESKIEINDQLITQGGRRGDSTSVNKQVYAYIKLRSGYNRALLAVQKAKMELQKTYLYSPISATVANLTISPFNLTGTVKPFCTLINRLELLVRCPILETELSIVQKGQRARIVPVGIPTKQYIAKVTDINPIVNAQGLVDVSVKVLSPDKQLISGMNVQVIVEKNFPNLLIVPKAAVVERSNRKVVFTVENGAAQWHYVTTGQENDSEIVILEGLENGQEVIVSGNLNLAHDSKVSKD